MEHALAFGCTWFWIVTILFALWAIICVEATLSGGASFVIALYIGLLYYFGNLNPFPWIVRHPAQTMGLAAIYLVGGTVWTIIKWRFYVFSKARQCEELRVTLGKQNEWKAETFSALGEAERTLVFKAAGLKTVPPSVLDEKPRIMAWMVWWPLSAAWTIVDDPIRRMFQQIYHRIAGHLQAVSDKAFQGLKR